MSLPVRGLPNFTMDPGHLLNHLETLHTDEEKAAAFPQILALLTDLYLKIEDPENAFDVDHPVHYADASELKKLTNEVNGAVLDIVASWSVAENEIFASSRLIASMHFVFSSFLHQCCPDNIPARLKLMKLLFTNDDSIFRTSPGGNESNPVKETKVSYFIVPIDPLSEIKRYGPYSSLFVVKTFLTFRVPKKLWFQYQINEVVTNTFSISETLGRPE